MTLIEMLVPSTCMVALIVELFRSRRCYKKIIRYKDTQLQEKDHKLDEFRGIMMDMNTELDSKEAELLELAYNPESLIGVRIRTAAEIRKNQAELIKYMNEQAEQEQANSNQPTAQS